jgi:hypothetical protein
MKRSCTYIKDGGGLCQAAPLRDAEFCFWHDPEHAAEVAEARRLGGLRRRREKTLQGAYEFEGLNSIEDVRRLLEIAVMDTLGLENSVARSRAIAYLSQTALRVFEFREFDERLKSLESLLTPRLRTAKR